MFPLLMGWASVFRFAPRFHYSYVLLYYLEPHIFLYAPTYRWQFQFIYLLLVDILKKHVCYLGCVCFWKMI